MTRAPFAAVPTSFLTAGNSLRGAGDREASFAQASPHRYPQKNLRWSDALVSLVGILITIAALLGGFAAMGGHLAVLMQLWVFVFFLGFVFGSFFVAFPWLSVVVSGV